MARRKRIPKNILLLLCALLAARSPSPVGALPSDGTAGTSAFEFVDQDIGEILYAISLNRKVPIVPDSTVTGRASFRFAGGDFESAFGAFLGINGLYADRAEAVWTVSRIRLVRNGDGALELDANDVYLAQILDRLSAFTGRAIVRDLLPSGRVSIHLSGAGLAETLSILMRPYAEYAVADSGNFFEIRRNSARDSTPAPSPTNAPAAPSVRASGGLYSFSGERFRIGDALDALFGAAGIEYSSFVRGDGIVERLSFSDKSFDEALGLLLDQANAEAVRSANIWCILPGQQSEIAKRLRNGDRDWVRFPLKFANYAQVQPVLLARYPALAAVPLPGGDGFFARVTEAERADLVRCLDAVDAKGFRGEVRLKYIKSEELLKNPPPSVTRENLVDAGDGNALFFVGSRERYAEFAKDLETLDRPRARIRYDLLIMQYQDSSDLKWGFAASARRLAPGDQTMVTGSFGNILKLNFDVITVLGYQFAAQLDTAIAENRASVFADTTLYGLSGQDIKFQNTNTYRYRDYYIDSQTKETVYTGVTREITSGLVLDVNGWVSGDGMITTAVNASVSKRGVDVSSGVGNPPPTSEKTISTQVRSRSGETVVLSGLRQDDSTLVEERVPFISRIPLIGWLFRNRDESREKSQTVIYLIPRVDLGSDEYGQEGRRTESAYERLVRPYLGGQDDRP